jgi:glycerol-3-phosphate dehydrogenase subunit B
MDASKTKKYDICIIGTGLAGLAATTFALNRGLSCAQVGHTGEINFATGFLDLLGVHPVEKQKIWDDPWAGIDALGQDVPQHPYARLAKEDIRDAFDELLSFLKAVGLPYCRLKDDNIRVLTSMGTIKTTYSVPHTMWKGVKALQQTPSCLLIDIRGLKGFSARQIAVGLKDEWPDLHTAHISFPGTDHLSEVYTEHLASSLVLSENREKFARALRPHIKKAQVLGMPAILGLYRTLEIVSDLEKRIGLPLFEIPTIPPSIPGLRLKEAFVHGLRAKGVDLFSQNRVFEVQPKNDTGFELKIGKSTAENTVVAGGIILASGRFIGGGLHADRKRVKETIFDLPVCQPDNRAGWHRRDFLDPRGHLVNRAGLEIDDSFRPLNSTRKPAFDRLFAAGSILAHNDWKRIKCGAGLAIATAFGAVKSFTRLAQTFS